MSKQVLTVEQMQHLQELGLKLQFSTLSYVHCKLLEDKKCNLTVFKDLLGGMFEQIPAYTLQDILDVLPKEISNTDISNVRSKYHLELGYSINHWYVAYIDYDDTDNCLYDACDQELIDAAYNLLCLLVEHGNIETHKVEEEI